MTHSGCSGKHCSTLHHISSTSSTGADEGLALRGLHRRRGGDDPDRDGEVGAPASRLLVPIVDLALLGGDLCRRASKLGEAVGAAADAEPHDPRAWTLATWLR